MNRGDKCKREDSEEVVREFLREINGSGLTKLNMRYSLFILVDNFHIISLLSLLTTLLMLLHYFILEVSSPKVVTENLLSQAPLYVVQASGLKSGHQVHPPRLGRRRSKQHVDSICFCLCEGATSGVQESSAQALGMC